MDVGRFVVELHLSEGRPVAELARVYGVHRSWIYKRLARYRLEGEAGLELRSRRPKTSPTRIADRYESEIIALRKQLEDDGYDAGPQSIYEQLIGRHDTPPSASTIYRVLRARGFVTPEPKKRPKSSYVRFEAALPNERWQIDMTHWRLADGEVVEVLNIIDDHSRLCVSSRVFTTVRSSDVVRSIDKAAEHYGYPETLLSDNGAIFTASYLGGTAAMEAAMLSLGVVVKHSRPYHPQTCGKIERFHQTQKRFLVKQEPAQTKKQLQAQIDHFVTYYNTMRPHRSTGRRTPSVAFTARARAYPTGPKINVAGYRVRHDRIDKAGVITIRYKASLHHVGLGRRYAGWRVIVLIADREVRVLTIDGKPLRHFMLDPAVDYQRQP